MAFSRKSYKLTSDAERSRVTGKGWQGREEAPSVEASRKKTQRQACPGSIEPQALLHLPGPMSRLFSTSSHGAGHPPGLLLWPVYWQGLGTTLTVHPFSLLTCGPGIVHEKLLSDYLHRVFASPDHRPAAATSRYGRMALPFLCGARPEAGGWGVGREAGLWGGWLAFCPRSDAPDCETCGPESTRVCALAVLVPPLRE